MFDLNADWASIAKTLRSDPAMSASVQADPGIRVPGCWNGFELAVRAILGQQVTVNGATSLAGRIAAAFGKNFHGPQGLTHLFPSPETLASAKLTSVGLTTARAETIRALARAVSTGAIKFEAVVDSDAFLHRLCEIPGIGPWTAQYVAMRALGEPNAFPSSDLWLLRALVARQRTRTRTPSRALASLACLRSDVSVANARGPPRPCGLAPLSGSIHGIIDLARKRRKVYVTQYFAGKILIILELV